MQSPLRLLVTLCCGLFVLPAFSQQLAWVKTFGGSLRDEAYSLAVDANGNVLIAGKFGGVVDFDPGLGEYLLTATSPATPSLYHDLFVVKLDPAGNFLWARATGGSAVDEAAEVRVDGAGNVIVTGFVQHNVDLDPGPGELWTNGNQWSNEYPFIQKFDPNGNLLWAKFFDTYCDALGLSVTTDDAGNILWAMQGQYFTVDIAGAPVTFTSAGYVDIFVLKIQPNGTVTWCKQVGGASHERVFSIATDPAGNVVLGGSFAPGADFDPGPGVVNIPGTAYPNGFVLKLDPAGQFVWVRSAPFIAGTQDDYYGVYGLACDAAGNTFGVLNSEEDSYVYKLAPDGSLLWKRLNDGLTLSTIKNGIALDSYGNCYTSYHFVTSADINPGPGINTVYSTPALNCSGIPGDGIALQKLNPNGIFVWGKAMPACGDEIYGLATTAGEDLLVTGYYHTGFNLAQLNGPALTAMDAGYDVFVARISQDACSGLTLLGDSVPSLECTGAATVAVTGAGGVAPWTWSYNGEPFTASPTYTVTTPGLLHVVLKDSVGCMDSTDLLVNAPVIPQSFDLKANLVTGAYRPGFNAQLSVDAYSEGCVPVSGQLKLLPDPLVALVSAVPAPDFVNGDTLTWNFTDLTYASAHLVPQLVFHTSTQAQIGDSVRFLVAITPLAGDALPADNVREYLFPVVNGYDPNDKKAWPQGKCVPHLVNNDDVLTYTVRFQNTGNSAAINIRIEDVIDVPLNLSTLRVIGSSHPLYTEVNGATVNFRFDSILLPPAVLDSAASMGYVIYEIHQDAGLFIGTTFSNTARIYFDFNPPIITNTVSHTVFGGDLETFDCATLSADALAPSAGLTVYPNPSGGVFHVLLPDVETIISVTDLHGRTVRPASLLADGTLDLTACPPGIYFLQAVLNGHAYTVRLVRE